MKKPLRAGSYVMYTEAVRSALVAGCREHIHVAEKATRYSRCSSGWLQAAKCVECGTQLMPVDSGWWVAATGERALRALASWDERVRAARRAQFIVDNAIRKTL